MSRPDSSGRDTTPSRAPRGDWLFGSSPLADLIRGLDWATTPLGPLSTWPEPLRTTTNILLGSRFPMALLWSPELVFIYNDAYQVIAGERHPAALGSSTRTIWPEVWHINEPIFRAVMERGETVFMEDALFPIRRGGAMQEAYFTLCYSPVRLEDGEVGGTLVTLEETTARVRERQASSDALRQKTALLRAISDSTGDAIFAKDRQGRIRFANPTVLSVIGKPEGEVLGRTDLEFLEDEEIARAVMENDRRVMESGVAAEFEERVRRPDGTEAVWASRKVPYRGEEGAVVGLLGISRDVTEAKRAEEALRAKEAVLARAQATAHLGSSRWDLVHDTLSWSDELFRIFGVDPATFVPSHAAARERIHPDDRDRLTRQVTAALGGAAVAPFESRIVRPGGEERVVLASGFDVERDPAGKPIAVLGTMLDITDRKRVEEALREGEERYRLLFQNMLEGFAYCRMIFDEAGEPTDFVHVDVNAMFGQLTGLHDVVGRRVTEVIPGIREQHPELLAAYGRVVRTGAPTRFDIDFRPLGLWLSLAVYRPHADHFVVIFDNITDRKRAEQALHKANESLREAILRKDEALEELERALEVTRKTEEKFRQAQKMEAVGRLAGGVAHDFNNLLTVILGNADTLLTTLFESDPARSDVLEIQRAGERAASLTRQLLAFSRKQVLKPRVVDVNVLLTGLEKMARRLIGEDIEISMLLDPKVHPCRIDPGQFEQAVVNLVVNARDAMSDGGRLTIETANVHIDQSYVDDHPDAKVGDYVRVTVSDTGHGMPHEVQKHLFEPFFTTKASGQGTGLGLSTVYGIVHQSGGMVWVYSEPGQGTAFRLYFPSAGKAELDAAQAPIPPLSLSPARETVLLTEDDEQVRSTVASMLRKAGYHVLMASNGGEALLICEQHGGRIDLLLTDVVMPKLNGRKLADRLLSVRPGLRVLFMSGYTENAIVHHGVLDAGLDFLAKPITREALLVKVREVLDRGTPPRVA